MHVHIQYIINNITTIWNNIIQIILNIFNMCVYKNDVRQLLRAREREREWRVVYSDTSLSEWGAGLRDSHLLYMWAQRHKEHKECSMQADADIILSCEVLFIVTVSCTCHHCACACVCDILYWRSASKLHWFIKSNMSPHSSYHHLQSKNCARIWIQLKQWCCCYYYLKLKKKKSE